MVRKPTESPSSSGGSMSIGTTSIERSLCAARGGCPDSLGRLFEEARGFLQLIANQELAADLRAKVAPSDLVQETFLDAQRRFDRFTGTTERELLAWLRRILLNNLRDAVRSFRHTVKREVRREQNPRWARPIPQPGDDSPSRLARLYEDQARLLRVLNQLSDDHRRVIEMRNLELRSFVEIGHLMDRTPDAARKLWRRAIQNLEERMGPIDAK